MQDVRGFVELLLIPICLIAALVLFYSFVFASIPLTRSAGEIVSWMLIVSSPAWFYALLAWSKGSQPRTTAVFAFSLVLVAIVIGYVLTVIGSA